MPGGQTKAVAKSTKVPQHCGRFHKGSTGKGRGRDGTGAEVLCGVE